MAALDFFRPVAADQRVWGRVLSFVTGLYAAAANWRASAQTRKALLKLSDHELDDIGLVRGDIDAISARIMH